MEPNAELCLSIMGSIAQEESSKTSSRVKWGQTQQMERRVGFGPFMLGYDVKNGKITILEQGSGDSAEKLAHEISQLQTKKEEVLDAFDKSITKEEMRLMNERYDRELSSFYNFGSQQPRNGSSFPMRLPD